MNDELVIKLKDGETSDMSEDDRILIAVNEVELMLVTEYSEERLTEILKRFANWVFLHSQPMM
jgi:hypothetical protein